MGFFIAFKFDLKLGKLKENTAGIKKVDEKNNNSKNNWVPFNNSMNYAMILSDVLYLAQRSI